MLLCAKVVRYGLWAILAGKEGLMNRPLLISLIFFLGLSNPWEGAVTAEPKKPTADVYRARCDQYLIDCHKYCGSLIDIGTTVSDCNSKCRITYARCIKRAGQMGRSLPEQGTGINNSDQLKIKP